MKTIKSKEEQIEEYFSVMVQRKLWATAYQCSCLLHKTIEEQYRIALTTADSSSAQADVAHAKEVAMASKVRSERRKVRRLIAKFKSKQRATNIVRTTFGSFVAPAYHNRSPQRIAKDRLAARRAKQARKKQRRGK